MALTHEPMSAYQAKSKDFLSSHALGDFRRAPVLFRRKELHLAHDVDRPAFMIGRAAHTLILEGSEVFEREYAIGGPINEKTGKAFGTKTKAFEAWAREQGKPVLSDEQFALIQILNLSVHNHEGASRLLSSGTPEGVARANYKDTPAQIRIDWHNPDEGIVDLKTCDDLTWFESDARKYGYAHQLAFYRSVLAVVLDKVEPVYIIAVEKKEPYRTGLWRVGTDVLGVAQKDNEAAISRLKTCRKTDVWPSGYEEIRTFDYI